MARLSPEATKHVDALPDPSAAAAGQDSSHSAASEDVENTPAPSPSPPDASTDHISTQSTALLTDAAFEMPEDPDNNGFSSSSLGLRVGGYPDAGDTQPQLSSDRSDDSYVVVSLQSKDLPSSNRSSPPRNRSAPAYIAPLTPPNNPPTAQDWINYRSIFTKLYRSKTLKEAKSIMEERYSFVASERMYKKRIAEWGLQKYSSRGNRKTPPQESASSGHEQDSQQSKQQVTSARVRRVNRHAGATKAEGRAMISAKRASLEMQVDHYMRRAYPTVDYGRFKSMSEEMKNVEIILSQIDNYFKSYNAEMWERKFPKTARGSIKEIPLAFNIHIVKRKAVVPMAIHPGDLFNRFHMAAELLKLKTPQANNVAWRIVEEAFDMVKEVVLQQHPQLLRYFFMQFWDSTYDAHPQIREQLFKTIVGFAEYYLGRQHPITLISKLLPRVQDPPKVCEVAYMRNIDTFDSILGPSHNENLRSKMAVTGNYIDSERYEDANHMLWSVANCFTENSTAYYKRAALCRIAWIHTLQQQYAEAEPIFVDVLERCKKWSNEQPDKNALDDVFLAATTHLARLQARRSYEQGKAMLRNALDRCIATVGSDHAYTYTIQTELENLKRVAQATDLLEDFRVGV